MGLDAYLSVEKVVGGWEHGKPAQKKKYRDILKTLGINGVCGEVSSLTFSVDVAYWRNNWPLHIWFVKNVPGCTVDVCRGRFERETLEELLEACNRVVAGKKDKAFGKKEENFLENIKNGVKEISEVLNNKSFKDCHFCYRAWWWALPKPQLTSGLIRRDSKIC